MLPSFVCNWCASSFRIQARKRTPKYCSRNCSGKGRSANRVVKTCNHCGDEYPVPPSKYGRSKYCSRPCFIKARRMGAYHHQFGNKDKNHDSIVKCLKRLGCSVVDTVRQGAGFPDVIVGFRGENYLVEIKNLETSYGRSGLSENQTAFAATWSGGAVYVISTDEDCITFVQGDRESLRGS